MEMEPKISYIGGKRGPNYAITLLYFLAYRLCNLFKDTHKTKHRASRFCIKLFIHYTLLTKVVFTVATSMKQV